MKTHSEVKVRKFLRHIVNIQIYLHMKNRERLLQGVSRFKRESLFQEDGSEPVE